MGEVAEVGSLAGSLDDIFLCLFILAISKKSIAMRLYASELVS